MAPRRKHDPLIAWTTITYRSVILAILFVALLTVLIMYAVFPAYTKAMATAAGDLINKAIDKAGLGGDQPTQDQGIKGPQQANFTAIEGTVRVRKNGGNNWTDANFNMPLEKGDVVQTGADGIAKIVFVDGTNYVVKQDSLIVIEENSANSQQQTSVAVAVTTGTVDLTTATYTDGSKSSVIVAGARASFSPETAAHVRNDPKQDQHEIMVSKGAGVVARNNEVVKIGNFEAVSFTSESAEMTKTKEIGPPTLISPANMMPMFSSKDRLPVDFTWSQVRGAKAYRIRVSKSPFFSSTIVDKTTAVASIKIPALDEGAYYWVVQSIDDKGHESVESEKNRLTVIPKGSESLAVALELQPFVQHGHVIELKGRTEPQARVMVNGEEVPVINSDGTFQYFTHPLPNGENVITVTAQNTRGGVKTRQQKVVIQ